MIKITEIKLPLDAGDDALLTAAASVLRCPESRIRALNLTRKAVDSVRAVRKRVNLFLFIFSLIYLMVKW